MERLTIDERALDEAIARERQQAERNMILLDSDELVQKSYDTYLRAEYHEQIVEWLEELKAIKSDDFTDDLLNMGFTKGYNKALDDCVRFANTMPTVELEDGTIRPMWLEEMAEKLKEKHNEQRSIGE